MAGLEAYEGDRLPEGTQLGKDIRRVGQFQNFFGQISP